MIINWNNEYNERSFFRLSCQLPRHKSRTMIHLLPLSIRVDDSPWLLGHDLYVLGRERPGSDCDECPIVGPMMLGSISCCWSALDTKWTNVSHPNEKLLKKLSLHHTTQVDAVIFAFRCETVCVVSCAKAILRHWHTASSLTGIHVWIIGWLKPKEVHIALEIADSGSELTRIAENRHYLGLLSTQNTGVWQWVTAVCVWPL